MTETKQPDRPPTSKSSRPTRLSAEQWVLLAALLCFLLFVWIVGFLFLPLLAGRSLSGQSLTAALPPSVVNAAATRGFVLPPTWTPGPTPVMQPTGLPTQVYDGADPTRIYTPRPTSLPGVVLPFYPVPTRIDVVDLARIMEGESRFDLEAAYYVGWVAKNRLLHPSYGDSYALVSSGFFGYRHDIQPRQEFIQLAQRVIRSRQDPTGGCLFALSRDDINKLGVSPSRADVVKNQWYFFRTWPLNGRL